MGIVVSGLVATFRIARYPTGGFLLKAWERTSLISSSGTPKGNCSRSRGRKGSQWKFRTWLPLHKRPNSPQIPASLNSYAQGVQECQYTRFVGLTTAPAHEHLRYQVMFQVRPFGAGAYHLGIGRPKLRVGVIVLLSSDSVLLNGKRKCPLG